MNVLELAAEAVDGPRQEKYGNPRDNHTATMQLFDILLGRFIDGRWHAADLEEQWISSEDQQAIMTCIFNICQKLSRFAWSPEYKDHLVDIAGYVRNIEIILDEREEPEVSDEVRV